MNRIAGISMGLVLTLLLYTCGLILDPKSEQLEDVSEPAGSPQAEVQPHLTSTTYYIRRDGGSPTECTGRVDAPYPGGGTDQPCAWDHPFRALSPSGEPDTSGTARIVGGDTLIIAPGAYPMGLGAPGAEACSAAYPWDCVMAPLPSGPDPAHPTRILGAGWDTGCPNPPELWGRERIQFVLNLNGSDNVEVACLELTDHAGCVEDHTGGLACDKDAYPFGDWAYTGLYAEDAAHVILRHLDIHGMANTGIHAGRLTDWTVEDVRLAANGWVGWDGDIDGDDANAGTLTFRRWTVAWNGCAETYPGKQPAGCWGQSAGGYGDGVGTGTTGGDWVIEDAAFLHNTSDGLDLLYHRLGGSITIRRTFAGGNAGDQIKTTGPTRLENVIAVGNCGFFADQTFTYNVDPCRAGGSALAFTLHPGDAVTVVNTTITGQGDCLVITECVDGETCRGNETVTLRNIIAQGNPEFGSEGDTTCLTWTDLSDNLFALDHVIINEVKNAPDPCPLHSICDIAPGLIDERIETFDARLTEGSPAIDAGATVGAPSDDIAGTHRDPRPDIGAYEYVPAGSGISLYLPLIARAHPP